MGKYLQLPTNLLIRVPIVFTLSFICTMASYHIIDTIVFKKAPISIELAGCIDHNTSMIVERMHYDTINRFDESATFEQISQYIRYRAVSTANINDEIHQCFLEAKTRNSKFDTAGLIEEDLDQIQRAIKLVYGGILSSVTPNPERHKDSNQDESYMAEALIEYRQAKLASDRISLRLSETISAWFL